MTLWPLDPALGWTLRGALALLFAAAALHKLRDLRVFVATLADYRMLPRPLVAPAAVLLAAGELALALALLARPRAGGVAAILLLALYAAAIGWNLARGRRHIDCGCLGPAGRRALSGWLVLRNACLALPAVLLVAGEAPRALSWVDVVTALGGVVACALLWSAAHALAGAGSGSRPATGSMA